MAAGGHFENAQLPEFVPAFATPPTISEHDTCQNLIPWSKSLKKNIRDSPLEPGLDVTSPIVALCHGT